MSIMDEIVKNNLIEAWANLEIEHKKLEDKLYNSEFLRYTEFQNYIEDFKVMLLHKIEEQGTENGVNLFNETKRINELTMKVAELENKNNALTAVLLMLIADLNKKELITEVHKDYTKLI